MKVLEKGRPQAGWAKECKCTGDGNGGGGCGAKLLVDAGDLYKTHRYCRDEHDVFTTFKCPECGVETDIDGAPYNVTKNLPDGWEEWDERRLAMANGLYAPGTK